MSDKAYSNTKYLEGKKVFPKGCLRTIPSELNGTKGASSEIPIVIELLRESVLPERKRPPVFRDSIYIHGFVKENCVLKDIFTETKMRKKARITFHEWDDRFLVIFAADGEMEEQSYYMSKDEFVTFFNDGLHPNMK